MLDTNTIAKALGRALGKNPESAECFCMGENFQVDFLKFCDRPYSGMDSIITNGVSECFSGKAVEFVFTYNPKTLQKNTDLNAFIATYLQLHFLENLDSVRVGDYFKVPGILIENYNFVGIYTTNPCYFSEDAFSQALDVKFLWLIPIFQNEYEYIEKYGQYEFESYLALTDPDLSRFDGLPLVFSK